MLIFLNNFIVIFSPPQVISRLSLSLSLCWGGWDGDRGALGFLQRWRQVGIVVITWPRVLGLFSLFLRCDYTRFGGGGSGLVMVMDCRGWWWFFIRREKDLRKKTRWENNVPHRFNLFFGVGKQVLRKNSQNTRIQNNKPNRLLSLHRLYNWLWNLLLQSISFHR